jgi:hypothetical protein
MRERLGFESEESVITGTDQMFLLRPDSPALSPHKNVICLMNLYIGSNEKRFGDRKGR